MRKYCGMQEGLNALSDGRLNESDPNSEFAFRMSISCLFAEFAGEIGPFSLRLELLIRPPVQARFG